MVVSRAEIGTRLRRLRDVSGVSIGDVAEAAGKGVDLVYRWERGEREPGLEELQKVARLHGVEASHFFADGPVLPSAPSRPTPREALSVLSDLVDQQEEVERLRDQLAEAKAERDELKLEIASLKDALDSSGSLPQMAKGNRRSKDGRTVIGQGPVFGRMSPRNSDKSEISDNRQ